SPGKSPPEPEGGAGNGARAEMRRPGQRQWKSRCAWESRTPRGIPTFPQPQQQTFGYISNVSTTPARVTFLNGSTGGARRISAIRKRRGRKRLTTEITEGP